MKGYYRFPTINKNQIFEDSNSTSSLNDLLNKLRKTNSVLNIILIFIYFN